MADLGSTRNWLVKPSNDIEQKWLSVEIQSRKSQIVRLTQDIEDLKKGQIVKLEATILMLEKEVKELCMKFNAIDITIEKDK